MRATAAVALHLFWGLGCVGSAEALGKDWKDGCPADAITTLLFTSLNLSYPGLENVKAALATGNTTAACNEVAQYYADASTAGWLRKAAPHPGTARVGGSVDAVMLNDTYDFYGEIGRVPRNKDGGLDWHDYGPVGDDEFCYALNRHFVWPGFNSAWMQTGNPEYAAAFNSQVQDWTFHNLPGPSAVSSGNTTWRTIEAGIRSGGSWPTSFFGFQNTDEFKGSTRCAMVAGMAEHGRYLHAFGDAGNSNWRSMQYNGLGMVAIALPELNHAEEWYAHAASQILADMENGVYPDGVEDEETSMYHKVVALNNFDELLNDVMQSGRTPDKTMKSIVEKMYNYLAYSLDSSGYSPLNSDSDTVYNADYIRDAAETFQRSDWLFIATAGQNGTAPQGPPSAMFPWAGQLISRSGWTQGSQWSWFDVGPRGSSSHGHLDKLHISIRVGSAHLLVDSGRFSYDGTLAHYRESYGAISSGHNVLLLDGKQQVDTPAKVTVPISNDTWSIGTDQDRARASITFDGISGSATHTRSMIYQRGEFWVVVDRVVSDRNRSVQGLWHAHPNCRVSVTSDLQPVAHVVDNETHIGIDVVPMTGGTQWVKTVIINGQTTPVLQGWYSPNYGSYSPSPTVSYTGNASAGRSTFAWLLVPTSQGTASEATGKITSVNDTHVVLEVLLRGKSVTLIADVSMEEV